MLAAFIFLCLLRLHGFSIPAWHDVIDGSSQDEILAGKPRGVRTDDWVVMLPAVFAQDVHDPRFPVVSDLVGYGGVSTRVGYSVPVRSWITFFRPQVWGYFLGRDLGMAWHWWFRFLGLFYASFLAFSLLTGGRAWISLAASVALVFAPFFQFWAFNCEPIAAAALLCFVAAAGVARAASRRALLLWGLLLAWAGGCLALGFVYPPFQISMAWLLAFMGAGYFLRERERLRGGGHVAARVGVATGAVVVAGLAFAAYLVQNRETVRLVSGTVYPGQRFSNGGDLPVLALFSNFFTPFLGPAWRGAFTNESEGASFLFLFPLTGAAVAWEWAKQRRRPDPVFGALGCFCALGSLYAVAGFPPALAHLVFAGRVPGFRMVLPMGIADLVMVAIWCSSHAQARPRVAVRASAVILAIFWAAGILAVGLAIASRVEGSSGGAIALLAVGFLVLGVLIAIGGRSAVGALAIVSVAGTAWFNPLVCGGSDYLRTSPFSRKVLELDREAGGRSRWVVYEDPILGNLFRAIGVRAISGTYYYPQIELWSRLGLTDRGSEIQQIYNRYGHVTFRLPADRRELELQLTFGDAISVFIHPDHPQFAKLDLDYLVYAGPDRRILDDAASLSWVASIGDKHIFRVHRAGRADNAFGYTPGVGQ